MTDPTQGAAGLDLTELVHAWTPPPADEVPPELDLVGHLHPKTDPALEETPMSDHTPLGTLTPERPTKPVANIKAGDVIIWIDHVVRVTHVEHFAAEDSRSTPMVLVVGRGTDGRLWSPALERAERAGLATPEEIAEAEVVGHRASVVTGLRELADRIERHDLPVPKYGLSVNSVLDTEADLRRWAEVTGWEVSEPTERSAYLMVDAPYGSVSVHWQVPLKPAVVVEQMTVTRVDDDTEAGA